jgi:hypothetical protein
MTTTRPPTDRHHKCNKPYSAAYDSLEKKKPYLWEHLIKNNKSETYKGRRRSECSSPPPLQRYILLKSIMPICNYISSIKKYIPTKKRKTRATNITSAKDTMEEHNKFTPSTTPHLLRLLLAILQDHTTILKGKKNPEKNFCPTKQKG